MEFSFFNNVNEKRPDVFFYVHKEQFKHKLRGENVVDVFENFFKRNKQGLILIDLGVMYQFSDNSDMSLIASVFINEMRARGYRYIVID